VIAGRYRGRRLAGPRAEELRPTGDRLKETLFDILGPSIENAVVLDAFAGTGSIGIEALSRGAREVLFLDSNREASRLIRKNIGMCGVTGGYRILLGDVFTLMRMLGREGFRADVAFLDPPYRWGPYFDLLETLYRAGIAGETSRVVVEHHRKAALPEAGDGFRRVRTVSQGDKCLSFYRMAGIE
jgi:16S rRNA (guanine(966)-N(2))-methyltransferase RsmD